MSTVTQTSDGVMKRVAVYARVSTNDQARDGYGLDEQLHRCAAWAEREGCKVVDTFMDTGVSGTVTHRPALDRMLRRLDQVDAVVVSSLDRLGRSTTDLLALYDRFERAGVALVFLRENLDTSTPVGRLLRTLLSAIAEFERDLIVERTSAAITSRARTTGKPWGSTPKYGYSKGDDGHWSVEQSEAVVVQRIFREHVEQARSYSAIARSLNADGVPSRKRKQWTATVVRRILTSRHVLGYFAHGEEWIQGQHPPIIDEATWQSSQTLAMRRTKYAPKGAGRKPARHVFVEGMARCGICGAAMLPRSDGDVYVCRTRKATGGAETCPMPPIKRALVETAALRIFERIALDVDATRQNIAAQIDSRLAEIEAHTDRAWRDVVEKRNHVARVETDYLSGELPIKQYVPLHERLVNEQAAVEAEHAALVANADAVRATGANLDAEHETLQRLATLRAHVATKVTSARDLAKVTGDVGALRAAIGNVFEAVIIRPAIDPVTGIDGYDRSAEPVEGLQLFVEPHLRRDLFETANADGKATANVHPDGSPIFAKVPIDFGVDNLTASGVPE